MVNLLNLLYGFATGLFSSEPYIYLKSISFQRADVWLTVERTCRMGGILMHRVGLILLSWHTIELQISLKAKS